MTFPKGALSQLLVGSLGVLDGKSAVHDRLDGAYVKEADQVLE